jgi:hypothetical protein
VVDALIGSPEFVDYWTFRFSDIFRVSIFANGLTPKWSQSYWEWIRSSIETNRPYDEIARAQLSSRPNATNRDDVSNYSRSLPRALDAEVLLDAVMDVTGVPETFSTAVTEGSVGQAPAGTRAINLQDAEQCHPVLARRRTEPQRHLRSQAQQQLQADVDQRRRHPGLGAAAEARQADGQDGAGALDAHARQ